MEVENRLNCAEGPMLYGPDHKEQVIQRFTIFLTDEDENDLTIEESEEEKFDEQDNVKDGEPSCSEYKAYDDIDSKIVDNIKPKKKRGRKKKIPDLDENVDCESASTKKRRSSTFSCHHCSYISSWKTNLEKHLMAQHTGERPFKCPHCEYCSVHQFQLEKHWIGHHIGSIIHCHVCAFTTSRIEVYFKHFTHSHAGQKPHHCPECGRRAVSLSALELHIYEKHSSVPLAHECPHCPYKTFLSDNLRNHIEALHKCSECDFWSGSLREVRRHRKKEHRITSKNKQEFKRRIVMKNNNRHDVNTDDFENNVDSFNNKFSVFSPPKVDEEKPYVENSLETNKFPVIVSPTTVPVDRDTLEC